MTTWQERKQVGDAHERRVLNELEARGWTVAPWGQGVLPVAIQAALSQSESQWRHFPDLVAARDGEVITIDAKDQMRSGETERYAVGKRCVSFGLQFLAAFGIPVFYVFGNLGVLTPQEVSSYGTVGPRARGGAYYLVNGRIAHHFDDVFGAPGGLSAAA
jgi:Holliday junction resolvase